MQGYANSIKRYKLSRPNSKPSKSCLTVSKKKQFDREKNLNMREKVEFELYTLGNVEIKVALKKSNEK